MASPSDASARALVLAIDGPAGAGKTTLATAMRLLQPSVVIHMDDLYAGWDGLEAGVAQVDEIIGALRAGAVARYRRYDWALGAYGETVVVPESSLVIIEGVGSGGGSMRADCVVWLDAPVDVRRERAVARGDFGDPSDQHWDQWAALEAAHFARAQTRERADLIIRTE
ncbi:4-amino-4-deoxy-L-arabinose transferase [Nocardioides sp. Kera G14]|uniref:4-amino-4-deoxy-L-arabinose transferase n=1 Tax=Nocardioides sp. Kera G14 TaxID=2884264 RepID=UPI001D0FF472|nr:4-amino-4-deoxy-L-arabinose transferase [Nocardioides sp. Kera G14]UDY25298.1 4-amino-4-deoxy-L-arabinose transferase [Nocardioides sp. Kera G14]